MSQALLSLCMNCRGTPNTAAGLSGVARALDGTDRQGTLHGRLFVVGAARGGARPIDRYCRSQEKRRERFICKFHDLCYVGWKLVGAGWTPGRISGTASGTAVCMQTGFGEFHERCAKRWPNFLPTCTPSPHDRRNLTSGCTSHHSGSQHSRRTKATQGHRMSTTSVHLPISGRR